MSQNIHQEVALGISRGLAADYHARSETPDRLRTLVARLSLADDAEQAAAKGETGCTIPEAGPGENPGPARRELDQYLARMGAYLPNWLCETVKWIRKPERFAARAAVSLLLVLGGVFSFLPVLGLWMLPLGLIVISQDLVFLQRPLVRTIRWIERHWRARRG
jgi:hypothetical protein